MIWCILLLVATATAFPSFNGTEYCTGGKELVSHPTDCNAYFECIGSRNIFERQCPDGLYFNPDTLQCDRPENVNCTSVPKEENDCQYSDSYFLQFLPHPNCSMFYVCKHGIPHEEFCPSGQHFCPLRHYCDFPNHVQCAEGEARQQPGAVPFPGDQGNQTPPDVEPTPSGPKTTTQEFETVTPDPVTSDPWTTASEEDPRITDGSTPPEPKTTESSEITESPITESPITDPPKPDPTTSPEYPTTPWTNTPSNTESPITISPNPYPTTSPGHPITPTWVPPTAEPPSQDITYDCEDINYHRQLLPHPDCGRFYQCDWGNPIELNCPNGLHFNYAIQVCDNPETAQCIPGEAPIQGSRPATDEPASTTEGSTPPGPKPCTTYPDPNPPTTNGPTTESPITVPPNPNPTTPPSNPPTSNPPQIVNDCQQGSNPSHQLLPHPDCGKFYQCVWGTPVEMICPYGLHFHNAIEVCDYPAHANCVPGEAPIQGEPSASITDAPATEPPETHPQTTDGPTPPGPKPSTTESPVTIAPTPDPTTPPSIPTETPPPTIANDCQQGSNPGHQLLPHPDCGKFYQCVWGTPVEMPCPGGQHFHNAIQVCDYPAQANCIPGQAPIQR